MSVVRIVAYTYEADVHCPECAYAAYHADRIRVPDGEAGGDLDEHSLWTNTVDREGNRIHPVFTTDEVTTSHFTHCGTCLKPLEN